MQGDLHTTMPGLCIIVTFVIFLPVTTLGECRDIAERPCCREAESEEYGDADPQAVSKGTCVFDNTLCSYFQGCADSTMSSWMKKDEFAYAHPKSASFYDDQTVLVSPLLDLRQSCRFTISYGLFANGDMDAFLEDSRGDHVQLIMGKRQWFNELTDFKQTVPMVSFDEKRYGRIKIRAKGGGHRRSMVKLYSVSLGDCKGCTFDDGFCGWNAIGWNRTSGIGEDGSLVTGADNFERGHVARLVNSFGSLSSTWIGSTSASTGCVRFQYMVWGVDSGLNVSVVDLNNTATTMWRVIGSAEPRRWRTGVVPVRYSQEYRIRLTGQQNDVQTSSPIVALDSVLVSPDTPYTQCRFEPPEASPGGSQSFTTVPTASPTSVESSHAHTSLTSVLTSTHAGSGTHDGGKNKKKDESKTSLSVIIGASVAGGTLFLVVIILLVYLMWRKRQNQRNSSDENDDRQPVILSKEGSRSYLSMGKLGGDCTDTGDSHFPHRASRASNDYSEIGDILALRNSTRPNRDDSPYEPAKAFPDKSHLSATPTKTRLAPTTDQTEDDYSHIPGSGYTSQTTQSASRDDYHTLNFERKELSEDERKQGAPVKLYDQMQSGPDDAYNKTQIGKRTVVIDSDYDHVSH